MNGGKHVAKERGIISGAGIYKRIETLIKEEPWLVVKALSELPEAERKNLKWIISRI